MQKEKRLNTSFLYHFILLCRFGRVFRAFFATAKAFIETVYTIPGSRTFAFYAGIRWVAFFTGFNMQ
jgi:hypothetical protein